MRCAFVSGWLSSVAAACLSTDLAAADCPAAEIVAPERGALVGEPRPAVEWRALPGVSRYRVQLESRVPEGRVVTSTDSVVEGTRFVPPANLAESRAAVKLLVTALCGDAAARVSEQPARFYVDLARACPPVSKLSFEIPALADAGGAGKVAWTGAAAATRFEVVLYAMPGGEMMSSGETPSASYDLPGGAQAMLVAVRPRCGAAVGPAAYGWEMANELQGLPACRRHLQALIRPITSLPMPGLP